MIYKIESKQNKKIKDLLSLNKPSERLSRGEFIIEGFHLLEMALLDNCIKSIFSINEIKNIDKNIDQYIVSEEIMNKISSSISPQGVVAVCQIKQNKAFSSKKILYLDDISDPGNLGTLFRTALAFGYNDIILSKNTCSKYNSKVIQSSQGAIFKLNIVDDDSTKLINLKKKGYKLISTQIKGSIELNNINEIGKHILILGNEAHGVSQNVLKICDLSVRIDIQGIESLNVGVAGGILMHYLSLKLK